MKLVKKKPEAKAIAGTISCRHDEWIESLKPTTRRCAKEMVHARENIPLRFWSDLRCVKKRVLFSLLFYLLWYSLVEHVHDTSSSSRDDLRAFCIQHLDVHVLDRDKCRSKARHPGPTRLNHITRMTRADSKINQPLVRILYQFKYHFNGKYYCIL